MNTDNHNPAVRHESTAFVHNAVERHQAPLLRYATRLLGGDAEGARDVVQDTFVRLMAQPPERIDGHVVEWLFTVCRNRVRHSCLTAIPRVSPLRRAACWGARRRPRRVRFRPGRWRRPSRTFTIAS